MTKEKWSLNPQPAAERDNVYSTLFFPWYIWVKKYHHAYAYNTVWPWRAGEEVQTRESEREMRVKDIYYPEKRDKEEATLWITWRTRRRTYRGIPLTSFSLYFWRKSFLKPIRVHHYATSRKKMSLSSFSFVRWASVAAAEKEEKVFFSYGRTERSCSWWSKSPLSFFLSFFFLRPNTRRRRKREKSCCFLFQPSPYRGSRGRI